MKEQDQSEAKLAAVFEAINEVVREALADGVSAWELRRALLARAAFTFKADPAEGIAEFEYYRRLLVRELIHPPVAEAA
ncbi:hypothetical protein [Croceicoccus bisphenolivorans]|uniref:hypothetical protein n=1 Tax=Croceicoccus bisphenolivorans TaxID=1783232 RepID=UPI00082AC99D|nr:hypothetical protein [Croceicoccus bisphenolivorans]